jgi:hypothetical protein
MAASLPLSYWLPGESHMTPSHTATSFFIAIRIRFKGPWAADHTVDAKYDTARNKDTHASVYFLFLGSFVLSLVFVCSSYGPKTPGQRIQLCLAVLLAEIIGSQLLDCLMASCHRRRLAHNAT